MGLMSKIFGEGSSRQTGDYVELDADGIAVDDVEARLEVRIANIGQKTDVIDIKDEVYDGNIVLADITRYSTNDRTMEQITDELKQVTKEVGGDIVQKDDDQLIITPAGVRINRDRLGK